MTLTNTSQRRMRPVQPDPNAHLLAIGQTVRLKSNFGAFPKTSDLYQITGKLPPRGGSPQYRIRNEEERHERVTTQDNLEIVQPSSTAGNASLIERTFGHGQRTETQQPRDQKAEAGETAAQG